MRKRKANFAFLLSIQNPNAEIQICREGQPDQIWNLQQGCKSVNPVKLPHHQKHQCPQKQQPKQCKSECLGIEEDQTPEEIDDQLSNVQIQSPASCFTFLGKPYPSSADTHKCVQNCPHNSKKPSRGCQHRLCDRCFV